MKAAKWETTSGALSALLATRSFASADLYTITLAGGGTPLRYTTADTDIGYSGNTWTHGGPLFDLAGSRAVGHWKTGLDTDTWHCTIAPRAVDPVTGAANPDMIGSVPWLAAARAGALDGAIVTVDRAYLASWPAMPRPRVVTPTGVVNIFTGRVATVDIGRSAAIVTLNSHIELLGMQMPRHLYQAGCRHVLFDAGCGLSAAGFGVGSSVQSGSTAGVILAAATAPSGSGSYTLGRLVMTSGKSAGFARAVRAWTPPAGGGAGSFTLLSPFPFVPAPGDTFTAWPGCDKQMATCALFSNSANFGGMPFIPAPETSV